MGARRSGEPDRVKQEVAAHWNRRAPGFDADFGHSIRTPAERAAWDRILDLVVPARGKLDALDVGCGTGFLVFELAARGHRVTGVDFAPAMIAEARRKAADRALAVRLEEADAEQLPFAFDPSALTPPAGSARSSQEYAAVGDQLPFLGGRSREEIERLLTAHGLGSVCSDPLHDLVAAQAQRMVDEGLERRTHRRYVVWGDLASR
ncbi:MAG: hypothetical protein DME02_09500 [Candidatus Rokuibacteriota bacterium]|nr:MAG: hypothetical protein DME02_09500 [Candidatus Rokubacteria bacterium]